MAGRYVTLVAAADYLEAHATLVSARALASEAEADRWIDSQFAGWDRSTWSIARPPEVEGIAKKYASGEYLRRDHVKAAPDAQPSYVAELIASGRGVATPSFAGDLMAEAKEEADRIRARGYLIAANGEDLIYADAVKGSGMFQRVTR